MNFPLFTKRSCLLLLMISLSVISCNKHHKSGATCRSEEKQWQNKLKEELPLLGHRNWILVVDKAFPLQTAQGIEVINTNENLKEVLRFVLSNITESSHVKPNIYTDKELDFLHESQVKGVDRYKQDLKEIIKGHPVQNILHDSVFVNIDRASKLFKILVLKTNETIPYSSVFLQLDCKYWQPDQEADLRKLIKNNKQ